MTKNVSLSFVVCFPRKRSLTERKSPLLGAQTVSLPFSARLLETTTHTTQSRTPLSVPPPPKTREKTLSLSLSLSREKETYFFRLLVARSLWADLFPVHFLPFQKSFITRALSYALSRTRTQIASRRWRWYILLLYFLRIHRSYSWEQERKKAQRALVVLIFVWKHRIDDRKDRKKKLPLARKERRERETKKGKKKKKEQKKIFITPLASLIVDQITLFFLARVWSHDNTRKQHRKRMTTILTTKNNTESEESDATNKITIFVKLLPEPNNEEHKNLTRFQVRDSRSKYLGKTCVFRDVEKKKETILELKRKVERETGEKVETLRRGSLLVLSSSRLVLVFRLCLVFCARVWAVF